MRQGEKRKKGGTSTSSEEFPVDPTASGSGGPAPEHPAATRARTAADLPVSDTPMTSVHDDDGADDAASDVDTIPYEAMNEALYLD